MIPPYTPLSRQKPEPAEDGWGVPIKTTKGLSLEIVQGCQQKCIHCSHYCNYNRKGYTSLPTIAYTLLTWSRRLAPSSVCISGGECLLHPKIADVIYFAKQCFPHAWLRIFTNGCLLKKRIDEIAKPILDTGATVVVSVKRYTEVCKRDWTAVVKEGILECNKRGIAIELRNKGWTNVQAPTTADGKPGCFHGDPNKCFVRCAVRNCARFIYRDMIWNCPPQYVAYKMAEESFIDEEEWSSILSAPYATTETPREVMLEFFKTFKGPWCSNCRDHSQLLSSASEEFPVGRSCDYEEPYIKPVT
jgi:hypothetical protein